MKVTDLIVIILCLIIGVIIGRAITPTKTTTEYIPGKTVHDTIAVPSKPDTIYYPKYVTLPVRNDTIWLDSIIYVTQVVDTAAIIKDYSAIKQYAFNVFDNKYGKLDIEQTVQYNALRSFEYTHTPIQERVTIVTEPKYLPYVTIGGFQYRGLKAATFGGGVFIKNAGIEYRFVTDGHKGGHMVSFLQKF